MDLSAWGNWLSLRTQVRCLQVIMIYLTMLWMSRHLTSTFLSTERVLRILAAIGYLIEHEVRIYAANAMARYLSIPKAVAVLKFQ
jgi:hypothetical protein